MNPVHVRIRTPHLWVVAAACVLPLVAAAPASAQISPLGSAVDLVAFFVRGTDTVADPTTGGYVVVGGAGPILAVCVNSQGVRTAGPFTIKAPVGTYAAFPRVRYSPDVNSGSGGFLVVWPEEQVNKAIDLHARIINCIGGPVGAEQIISGGASAWLESGAAVSYSPTSKKFFVAWKTLTEGVKGRLVDLTGAGEGGLVQLSDGFGRDPGVAWNSRTNEFGVSFSGESGDRAYSAFARVPASNPAAFARTTFNVITGGLTMITDLDYNPDTDHFVMTWYEDLGRAGKYSRLAEFDSAGNHLGTTLASGTLGSYDALSLAFNPISRSFLLVGISRSNDVVLGAEFDRAMTRTSSETQVGPPGFYTRVNSSQNAKNWNVSFCSTKFNSMINQVVQTTSSGTPTDPTPPAPVPNPMMNVDVPGSMTSVSGSFQVAGWAIDAGAPTGTGVDAVHVWAYPVGGGAPTFLGAADYGIARPDLGAAAGAQFTNAGFGLVTSIPTQGTYDIVVYAHSTLTNSFNNTKVVRITVTAPLSNPRMWVDIPSAEQNLSQNIPVAGWALDLGSSSGTGVDAVHVWAYPVGGGSPVLVGIASYGTSRPDVAGAFGASRYGASGFYLQGWLERRGDYDLVVYAHSIVANSFNNVVVRRIHVN